MPHACFLVVVVAVGGILSFLFLFYSNVVLGVGLRAAFMQSMDSTS